MNKNYQEQTKTQPNPNIFNNHNTNSNATAKSNTIITLSQYNSPSLTPAAKNDCQIKFDFTYVNNTYLDEQASSIGSPLPTSTSNYHQPSSSSSSSFLNNNNQTTTTVLSNKQPLLVDNVNIDAGLRSMNRNQIYTNNHLLPNYEQNVISVVDSSSMPPTPQLLIDPNCESSSPMNDEDEMPIEDLGRDYLSKYNSIRRHTIATNEDNNMMTASNNIMKSTECLLDLNQKSGQETANTSAATTANTNTTTDGTSLCGNFSLGAKLNLANNLNQPNHSGFEANRSDQFNLNLSQLINYNLGGLGACGDLKNDYDYFVNNNNNNNNPSTASNLNPNNTNGNNYSTGKYKKNYLIPSNYHKCKHKSKFQYLNYFYTNNNNNTNSQENSNTNDAQIHPWVMQ